MLIICYTTFSLNAGIDNFDVVIIGIDFYSRFNVVLASMQGLAVIKLDLLVSYSGHLVVYLIDGMLVGIIEGANVCIEFLDRGYSLHLSMFRKLSRVSYYLLSDLVVILVDIMVFFLPLRIYLGLVGMDVVGIAVLMNGLLSILNLGVESLFVFIVSIVPLLGILHCVIDEDVVDWHDSTIPSSLKSRLENFLLLGVVGISRVSPVDVLHVLSVGLNGFALRLASSKGVLVDVRNWRFVDILLNVPSKSTSSLRFPDCILLIVFILKHLDQYRSIFTEFGMDH